MIPARPDGGACRFLRQERCTVHSARPFPCREYPLSVHGADRWQATVVLTCPGVNVDGLEGWVRTGAPDSAPEGFTEELGAVRAELASAAPSILDAAGRRWHRALRSEGIGPDPGSVARLRATVWEARPFPTDEHLRQIDLPEGDEGLAQLPLYFDAARGRVAIAASVDGAELLTLRESGGIGESLARYPTPSRLPVLGAEARALLEGYLGYVLQRDAFLGAVLEAREEGELAERLGEELRRVGADVISRAVWRAQLGGRDGGRLDADQIWDGIRATDADLLDRPTVGAFL